MLSQAAFLRTMPDQVVPLLPEHLRAVQVRQPWRWLIQFHFGEPRLHYEVARAHGREGWEVGFHFEARDRDLNRFLLDGMRRNLFEIKATLGDEVEAEMWDRGWTKIYAVHPPAALDAALQLQIGGRLAAMIVCLHPIFVDLRAAATRIYR